MGVFDGEVTERNVGGIVVGNVGVFDGEVTEKNVGGIRCRGNIEKCRGYCRR